MNKINKKKLSETLTNVGPLLSLFVLILVMSLLSDKFLTKTNILNVLKQISCYAVISIGMTYCFVGGGIDLSVGSQLGLYAVVSSMIAVRTGSSALGIAAIIVLGVAIGFIIGKLVCLLNNNAFIVTFAMQMVLRGVIMILTFGKPITGVPGPMRWFGTGSVLSIPAPIVVSFVLYLIGSIILLKTKMGRYTFAIGSNAQAAKITGINVDKYRTLTYIVSGLCCAVASLILTGRLGSALSSGGEGYEGDAIAATIIGGASMSGGEGNLVGTFIGAAIMGIVRNGLNLLQIPAAWQNVAVGGVILFAIILDQQRIKKKA